MTNLMTVSNRSGLSVTFRCSSNLEWNFVEAEMWLTSSGKKTYIHTSVYGRVFARYLGISGSGTVESRYSPQWNALVPTLTIGTRQGQVDHYVIVSQHGRVRASANPPS
jgi:hypothetical protein